MGDRGGRPQQSSLRPMKPAARLRLSPLQKIYPDGAATQPECEQKSENSSTRQTKRRITTQSQKQNEKASRNSVKGLKNHKNSQATQGCSQGQGLKQEKKNFPLFNSTAEYNNILFGIPIADRRRENSYWTTRLALTRNPFHPCSHVYRAVRSIETTLYQLTDVLRDARYVYGCHLPLGELSRVNYTYSSSYPVH